jgi:hypothetical protein
MNRDAVLLSFDLDRHNLGLRQVHYVFRLAGATSSPRMVPTAIEADPGQAKLSGINFYRRLPPKLVFGLLFLLFRRKLVRWNGRGITCLGSGNVRQYSSQLMMIHTTNREVSAKAKLDSEGRIAPWASSKRVPHRLLKIFVLASSPLTLHLVRLFAHETPTAQDLCLLGDLRLDHFDGTPCSLIKKVPHPPNDYPWD